MASSNVLQDAVDRLAEKRMVDTIPWKVQKGRAVFNKKLYRLVNSRESIADLDFATNPEVADKVLGILKQWAGEKAFSVLMSEHLPVHLGLPVRTYPPDCSLFQVLLLGKDLPFLLLTLYDGESVDAEPQRSLIEKFTTRCARMLNCLLLNFCLKDFILVPCTLKKSSFSVECLQKEVKVQMGRVADFYSGPSRPKEEAFKCLDRALSIVATSSEVPYFGEGSDDVGKKIFVPDPGMDQALHQFIAHITLGPPSLTVRYREEGKSAKAMLLEAALRLSYRQKVSIITDDGHVHTCVRKLAKTAEREYGLDKSWFQCVTVKEILNKGSSDTSHFDKHVALDKTSSGASCNRARVHEPMLIGGSKEDVETTGEDVLESEFHSGESVHALTPLIPSDPSASPEATSEEKTPTEALPWKSSSRDADPSRATPVDVCYIAIDAPDVPDDLPGLRLKLLKYDPQRSKEKFRILLVGKSGSGKSATGNTLMGAEKRFISNVSFSPVTRTGQAETCEYDDVSIQVVETPGIFNLTQPFNNACSPYSDTADNDATLMFDAVCFVTKIMRFTEEESHVFNRICKMFGEAVVNYMVVVFTGGDNVNEGEDLEDMLDKAPDSLRQVMSMCKRRYVVFDNTRPDDKKQVNEFLNAVRKMNTGRRFRCPRHDQLKSRWDQETLLDMQRKKRELNAG